MILTLIILAQTVLGIITLVMQVPLDWALYHQAGAIILLGFGVANWRALYDAYPSAGENRI